MNAVAPFHKILVPIDFSEPSLAALSQAVELVKVFDAAVTVVHVIPPVDSLAGAGTGPEVLGPWHPTANTAMVEERLHSGSEDQLRQAVAEYRGQHVDIDYRVVWGAPFREVIHTVQEEGYDLVVIGTRGRSAISRMLVGSTATKLVRKCPCPVWVVKPEAKTSLSAILAPIDFSDVSHESLRLAGALAVQLKCTLHLLHVFAPEHAYLFDLLVDEEFDIRPPWRRHEVISQLHAFARESGVALEPVLHVDRGDVAGQILATAEKIDAGLVVMGTLGRAGVAGLLIGNTAEKVLHHSERPLLAIKPVGYVSPVAPRLVSVET
jgi:universal stress protein E